jgi:hypothetical protein
MSSSTPELNPTVKYFLNTEDRLARLEKSITNIADAMQKMAGAINDLQARTPIHLSVPSPQRLTLPEGFENS